MKRMTLRQARERAALTQEQLAAKSGVRQGVISNLETGKIRNPGLALVLRLTPYLDVAPEQLRFGADAMEASR